jgi:hypothetical protein
MLIHLFNILGEGGMTLGGGMLLLFLGTITGGYNPYRKTSLVDTLGWLFVAGGFLYLVTNLGGSFNDFTRHLILNLGV